jgi:3-oxoacyl-(acyl-carrier-protein) synthase
MNMSDPIYINGLGVISPQQTINSSRFPDEVISATSSQLKCQEPVYKEYISGDMVRRMSRLIKMGVASSNICLRDAGCAMPDAIITGTGLGCTEDTEKFLATCIRNNEELLTPTSFIQSTHNTVSAQIALLLKCHGYNFTYCHRGFSFETALIDAMIRIKNREAGTVLAGASDELTANAFRITTRLGHWKRKPVNSLALTEDRTRGSIAGEGSAFFLLSGSKSDTTYATLKGVKTIYKPRDASHVTGHMTGMLAENGLTTAKTDLFLFGLSGDPATDQPYLDVIKDLPPDANIAFYKHLCGEYHTANAFGLWLASVILKSGTVPEIVRYRWPADRSISNIMLYNQYRNIEHTLILAGKA